jgi:hypothetical protein
VIQVVVEGDTDIPVARKLVASARLTVAQEIDCGGKDRLDRVLRGFNDAAKGSPWLVLRDLDRENCAPSLLAKLRFEPSRWMCMRIAVRETESWLLADAPGVARYFSVDESLLPPRPDELDDPVAVIVGLARRSASPVVRRGMVPARGHSVPVGPTYEGHLIDFGLRAWSLDRACRRSDSLARARRALRQLAHEWRDFLRGCRP